MTCWPAHPACRASGGTRYSPTSKAEPRVTLFTCLGRQMGAHPPAADEARRKLQGNRLKRLCTSTVAGPKHYRGLAVTTEEGVVNIRFWCRLSVLDRPACPVLPNEPSGPKRKICGGIDADFFTEGEGGAGLAIARLGRVPSWPRTGHAAARGRHKPAKIPTFACSRSSAPRI